MGYAARVTIGVFDGGAGGLSVLRGIRLLLPVEDLIYTADSAHCPYGSKPSAAIQRRARAIGGFLQARGAGVLVVACNTATSAAIDDVRARYPEVPVVGMEPALKPVAAATRSGVVGVLATGATLAGDRFAALVERYGEGVRWLTQPCHGLVERVEAGDVDSSATRDLLRGYVEPLLARAADTLVLG